MISVIVPVYNTEKYLHRCIDSILAQTYTDFELLLIDDGSTDSSGAICDEYALRDSRVRVFHKENGGVSSARNLGLDNAQGEWITFVDSDDWIACNALDVMLDNKEEDLIITSFTSERNLFYAQFESGCFVGSSINKCLSKYFGHISFTVIWGKLYKRHIIVDNKLIFDNSIHTGEDTLFLYSYIAEINSINIKSIGVYHYCDSTQGLSAIALPIEQTQYTILRFLEITSRISAVFGVDMSRIEFNTVNNLLQKSLIYVNNEYTTLRSRKAQLKRLLEDKHIHRLLIENRAFLKGRKRKLFDYFAIKKQYLLISLLLYFYQYQ